MRSILKRIGMVLIICTLAFPLATHARPIHPKVEQETIDNSVRNQEQLRCIRVRPERLELYLGTPEREVREQIVVEAKYKGSNEWVPITAYIMDYEKYKDTLGKHKVKIVYGEGECKAKTKLCIKIIPPLEPPVCEEKEVQYTQYVGGYEDGTFRAEQPVTREELATMTARLLTDNNVPDGENVYPDLNPQRYSTPSINYVTKLGIFEPYEDGTFRTKEPISSEEFAKLVLKLEEYTPAKQPTPFAVKEDLVTRAEAVVLLNLLFERACTEGEFENNYSDLDEDYWAYDEILCATNTFTKVICE